jgi:hypothetical protein
VSPRSTAGASDPDIYVSFYFLGIQYGEFNMAKIWKYWIIGLRGEVWNKFEVMWIQVFGIQVK